MERRYYVFFIFIVSITPLSQSTQRIGRLTHFFKHFKSKAYKPFLSSPQGAMRFGFFAILGAVTLGFSQNKEKDMHQRKEMIKEIFPWVPAQAQEISKQEKERLVAGNTRLHQAIEKDNSTLVETLLTSDPTLLIAKNNTGQTPLEFALIKKHPRMVQKLISFILDHNPALIHLKDSKQNSLLHTALEYDQQDAAQQLINAEIDVVSKNHEGKTPLQVAVEKEQTYVIQALNDKAEKENMPHILNVQDADGNTPLHTLINQGQTNLASLLVLNGANTAIKNNAGKTVLDLAKEKGMLELESTIQRFGTKSSWLKAIPFMQQKRLFWY